MSGSRAETVRRECLRHSTSSSRADVTRRTRRGTLRAGRELNINSRTHALESLSRDTHRDTVDVCAKTLASSSSAFIFLEYCTRIASRYHSSVCEAKFRFCVNRHFIQGRICHICHIQYSEVLFHVICSLLHAEINYDQ